MWRSSVFPENENENSDQSISEDDDWNGELSEHHVSLGIPAEKKGEVQILSQLDMLRDANEVIYVRNQTSLLQKKQGDTCVEDDVEFPIFANKDEFTWTPQKASVYESDEEILSDNEVTGNFLQRDNHQKIGPNFGGNIKDGICNWLAENAETDELINANDNNNIANYTLFRPVSAKGKRSSKGGQSKVKHKFSIRRQSHNNNVYKDTSHFYENQTSFKVEEMDGLMPAGSPTVHTRATTSMAGILLQVQDEHDLLEGNTMRVQYNKTKSVPQQVAVNRSQLSTGHDEDLDCLNGVSSEEDEYKDQIQDFFMPESKQKNISDQFQEALGAASINEEGKMYAVSSHTRFGLFGKLQRVMQSEKERDLYFLNKLQKEDDGNYFDVKILSKSVEAKLTVCACSSIDNDEDLNVIKRKNMTIIFSSRICSDVELEIGTLVRIHTPWKEVIVKGKEESTILSAYFSQI